MNYNQLTNENQILNWINKNPKSEIINTKDDLGQHILDWVFNGYRGKDENKLNICRAIISSTDISLLDPDTVERIFIATMLDKQENNSKNKHILDKLENYNILKQDQIESNIIINQINNVKKYDDLTTKEQSIIIKNTNKNILINESSNKEYLHPVVYCSLNISKQFNITKNLKYIYDYQHKNSISFQDVPFELKYFEYLNNDIVEMLDKKHTKSMHNFFEQITLKPEKSAELLTEIISKSKVIQLEKLLHYEDIYVQKTKI